MRPTLPAALLAATLLLTACGADAEPTADGPSGEVFGFVRAVEGDRIAFDEATWIADDAEPNGYRIEDADPTAVDLPLATDADIEVLSATGDPSTATTVDAAGLAAWFDDLGNSDEAAFDVTLDDGTVTRMVFRYRP